MKSFIKYVFRKVETFFLWSSGADLSVLQQVPMEKNKFLGIGGTIIFTALMASFAGGYAFFTAFKESFQLSNSDGIKVEIILVKSYYLAVFFGIFWGALIFNLDRFIVSTFGVGDGKKTISRQELFEATPRLIMAIILGFVISTPLELKLFEKEIKVEVENMIRNERDKLDGKEAPLLKIISDKKTEIKQLKQDQNSLITKVESIPNAQTIEDKQIALINDEINRLDQLISSNNVSYTKYNTLFENATDEAEKGQYKKIRDKFSNGSNLKKKSELLTQISSLNNEKFESGKSLIKETNELRKINQPKIEALEKEVSNFERQLLDKKNANDEVTKQFSGLMARMLALSNLTDRYLTIWFSKWLITLLFIFIEIAPILFKMMTERGPYDDIIDRIKHVEKVRQLEIQSNVNQEINTAVRIHSDKYEQKLNVELQSNKEVLEAISKAQQEIALVAIETWKEEQKKKMRDSGASIISSENR
ncbi:MAG: DUF4407 domain-containing protein [Bacteroidetes bacterium]|nr:DUF4407 domain-containing protein [Bacteroidota bacterium]